MNSTPKPITASGRGLMITDRSATDFSVADDTIKVDNAIFTAVATGHLAASAFFRGAAAHDADDRFIYNPATGALIYDRDGTGGAAAFKFATLAPGLALTHLDFFVV